MEEFTVGFVAGFGQAFMQFVLDRLANFGAFAWREIVLVWGVDDELRKLERTFLKIQDLVDHVQTSPLRFSGGSEAWRICFEDLTMLAYDADALLDHVSLRLTGHIRNLRKDEVGRTIRSLLREITEPHNINDMHTKLEDLSKEMKALLEIEHMKMDIHKYETGERSLMDTTSLLVDEKRVVGRQEDKKNVIDLLKNNGVLSVISLVGMAGLGKTTLAQLIFNDEKAWEGFKLKIWVSVSMDFDVGRITKSIIESATQSSCEALDLNSLQRRLQNTLSGERFLLVLDGYWNENHDDWDLLSLPFSRAAEGSKVIVTTRSSRVSTIVGSNAYNLQALSDDDCWKLMKRRAFFGKEGNGNLVPLGEKIAKKCKGSPLAAKALGSLLQRKSAEHEWLGIQKSELWDLPQYKDGVFPSLMLSYLHLPAHLRRCFAYCSIFPQNHEFQAEELVLLWMAECFIQSQGERRWEDIGREYFDDLHMRSFFTQGKSSSNDTIYKMHDLIHDLSRLVSSNTCFQVKHNMQHSSYPLFGNACHLSLHHDTVRPLELKASVKNERLRTFVVMCKNGAQGGKIDNELFCQLKFLRVLYLCNIGLGELPNSIDHLEYLRYLNLSENKIQRLPKSVCRLLALQTLQLWKCNELVALPEDMKNLSNLRHLMFDVGRKVTSTPPELGKLTNLQTLSAFIVGEGEGQGIEELGKMDLLRGSLCIKNIDKVLNENDAAKAKMNTKEHLDKLELLWEKFDDRLAQQQENKQFVVLNNLEPHINLKELDIKNYSGFICPKWISDESRKFTRICLQDLDYCTKLPPFGGLPSLQFLHIANMRALEYIDHEFYGAGSNEKFPSLVCLEVRHMAKLVRWSPSNGGNCMPNLATWTIEHCLKLRSLPSRLQPREGATITRCPLLTQSCNVNGKSE